MAKRPNSVRNLDNAIRRATGGMPNQYLMARTAMANSIIASIMPSGVVKGGSALKMRFGLIATRYTTDLDIATAMDAEEYIDLLRVRLDEGWEGFTGYIVEREPASPVGVPVEYVMRPFDVKLQYLGKPWCTVPLEIGHNEIGDADTAEWTEFAGVMGLFDDVGLPSPGLMPLMGLEYQIAQKLHALTGGDRPRDMVDLQIIMRHGDVDLSAVRELCVRLFAYRKKQSWPPTLENRNDWEIVYGNDVKGLPVLQSAQEAVLWVNNLIEKIDDAIQDDNPREIG